MNLRSHTAQSGGAVAPIPIPSPAGPPARRFASFPFSVLILLIPSLGFLVSCGVQAPPQPPRVERPAPVKDLAAAQVGRTFHLSFTLPVQATDGERLTKPIALDIYRAITPPGQAPASPSADGPSWITLPPSALSRYTRKGKIDYSWSLSEPEFHQWLGSTLALSVVTFTRGFRGHPRKSAPSNIARTKLLDVSEPVTHLGVQTTQAALQLEWAEPAQTLAGSPATNLASYRVYQSATGKPGSFQLLAETRAPHFADPDFRFGQTYYFRVSAVTAVKGIQAESEPSAPAEITPKDIFPPAVPRRLTALYAAGAVDLLWNADTDADLAGYNVYRRTASGEYERLNKQLLSTPIFHDATVAPNQNYEYAVTAVDLSGNESAKSSPASVSTSLPGGP